MHAQLNKTWTMGLFFLLVLFPLVLCNVQKLNKMTEETSGCVDKVLFYEQLELLYIGVTISILIGYKHAANSCWLCFRYVIPTDNSFYTCRSDVIPTDNSFMHAEVTSPNTLNSSLSNFVMAESTSRFATL